MERGNMVERILESFLPKFTEEKTSGEIMKKTKISYEPIYRHLNNLVKQKLVNRRRKGKTHLYTLNIENDEVRKKIEAWSIKKRKNFLNKFNELKVLVIELIQNIESLGPYLLSLVLFGSVARGKFTKKSDIDILIIISTEKGKEKDELVNEIDRICNMLDMKYDKTLSPLVISLGDFCKMLDEKKDFTKNLIRDSIVLYGEEIFYRELIRRFGRWQLRLS